MGGRQNEKEKKCLKVRGPMRCIRPVCDVQGKFTLTVEGSVQCGERLVGQACSGCDKNIDALLIVEMNVIIACLMHAAFILFVIVKEFSSCCCCRCNHRLSRRSE